VRFIGTRDVYDSLASCYFSISLDGVRIADP
jgi:hypothetical protein